MPKVTEIVVSAGRTFNHPHESYSNLRPQVTLKAELLPGEDPIEVAKSLQAQAEGLVEDHKRLMLESIEELYDLTQKQQRIASLRTSIERGQRELDDLRKGPPAPSLAANPEPTDIARCKDCGSPNVLRDGPWMMCQSCSYAWRE